jgi:hypothetical protein
MTLDEILNGGGGSAYEDVHEVLLINPVTRQIEVPSDELILGVRTDRDSEVKAFVMPPVVGADIGVCDCSVRVYFRNANGEEDYYVVDSVETLDDGSVIFIWLLGPNVTKYMGDVQFSVCLCKTVDGLVCNEWNTTTATGAVLEGLEPTEHMDEEFVPDIVQQLEEYVTRAEAAAAHPPLIGENETWQTWDGAQYVDSDKPTRGRVGPTGARGPSGVYMGSGEMPDDCNVQIDPDGDVLTPDNVFAQAALTYSTQYANALKGTASGAVIRVDDVSPLEHTVPVIVRSKNLFNYKDWVAWGTSAGNIAQESTTYLGEDCFSYRLWRGNSTSYFYGVDFKENTQYTFTVEWSQSLSTGGAASVVPFDIVYTDGTVRACGAYTAESTKFTKVTFVSAAGKTISHLTTPQYGSACTIYIKKNMQIEEGTTATAYTPYVPDVSAVTVKSQGKNLFDYRAWCDWCDEVDSGNGNPDDTYLGEECFSFRNYKASGSGQYKNIRFKENTQYTFSCEYSFAYKELETYGYIPVLTIYYTDGTNTSFRSKDPYSTRFQFMSVVSTAGKTISHLDIPGFSAGCWMYVKKNMQIEEGATTTEYEPYKTSGEYTPAEDGTCEVTSIAPVMTLTTDNTNVVLDCEYSIDTGKVIRRIVQAIRSLGGDI